MIGIINKIISLVLVPIYFSTFLPPYYISKLINKPEELVSLSEYSVGTQEDPIYLTAHRGVHALAPENSIPSFVEAVNHNYYSAECDIHLTKDNQWVVIHNSTVNARFCQMGKVRDYTLEELKTFSYKSGANLWKYKKERIPTLEEYLDVFVNAETRPQIEIKEDGFDYLDTVVDAIKAKGLTEKAIVISFNIEQLKYVYQLEPNIELWYLVDEITPENIAEAKAISNNVWLSANFSVNNTDTIKLATDAGVGISFWTVDTIEDAQMLYNMGIRYMETDILCN